MQGLLILVIGEQLPSEIVVALDFAKLCLMLSVFCSELAEGGSASKY
jgi:hypothetical protein